MVNQDLSSKYLTQIAIAVSSSHEMKMLRAVSSGYFESKCSPKLAVTLLSNKSEIDGNTHSTNCAPSLHLVLIYFFYANFYHKDGS